jgi:hypothetical protein
LERAIDVAETRRLTDKLERLRAIVAEGEFKDEAVLAQVARERELREY